MLASMAVCDKGAVNPLNSLCSLKTKLAKNPAIPIIDVVAMADETDVRFAGGRAQLVSPQIGIEGADHRFVKKEDEMVDVVIHWLKQQTQNGGR